MSGTLNNVYGNSVYALNLHTKALTILQEQISTGSRINRASDSPSDAYQVLELNSQQKNLENYMSNIFDAMSTLEITSSVITDTVASITDKKVELTQIINGIHSQDGRDRVAKSINSTLEQLVSLANTKHMSQYLFSGSGSIAPYSVQKTNGEITSVTYQGSYEKQNIEVAQGVVTNALSVGYDMFHSNDRSAPVFIGDTGAEAGQGTSNVTGDTWLTVTHDGTNYKLSIDNGATETTVPLAGTIDNIAVINADGKVLYVDATNITTTGDELVRMPGTYDIFNSLISIRDLLRNGKGLSNMQLTDMLDKSTNSLEEMRNHLVGKEVEIGSRIGFLDNLKDTLDKMKFDTDDQATLLQEADIAQIAIDLSRREILYQMSISAAGKLMSISLLDFLR